MLCLSITLLVTGCGGYSGPELGTVSGTVTNQGKPVAGVIIEFFPESGGRPSIATSKADGTYEAYFVRNQPGALPGKHKVRFEMRGPAPVVSEEDQYGMPPAAAAVPGGDAMPKNSSFQPDSVEVVVGHNEINFERLPNE